MKLKKGLSLNEMGNEYIVVSESPEMFQGMMKLNQSGAFIFRLLENGMEYNELVSEIIAEYGIDEETAKADIDKIIEVFRMAGLLDEK